MTVAAASPLKPLIWVGSSKRDLKALPESVIDVFGYGLHLAQTGSQHEHSKVLSGFGDASVVEIIESTAGSTYRAVYTVRFAAGVFVLHVFQKKSKSGIATPKPDMTMIEKRLKQAAQIAAEMDREDTKKR